MLLEYVNQVNQAPVAIGPYSQAVWAGDFLFVSGQIPIDPATAKLVSGDITSQAEQVFANLQAILASQSLTFSNVVKTTVYLCDLKCFQTVNAVYARFFGQHRPARATVEVAALPAGAQIEIELIAIADDSASKR